MGAMSIMYPPCNCCDFPTFEPPELTFPSIDEFVRDRPASGFPRSGWHPDVFGLTILAEFAQQDWNAAIRSDPPPSEDAAIQRELNDLVRLVPERKSRMAEIRSQDHDMVRAFTGQLSITHISHPVMFEVIKSACRVGEMLMAHYKAKHNRVRPAHLYPGLASEIVPMHPSYPSGHALVARLIARCLGAVIDSDAHRNLLLMVADRIAENREIAGLHFRSDSKEGWSIADQAFERVLPGCASFNKLVGEAKTEWASFRGAGTAR